MTQALRLIQGSVFAWRINWYRTAVRWLVFSSVYVGLCGGALTAGSYTLLGLPARIDAVVALVFASTVLIYNLDRLIEPHPGDSIHEQWVERHRRWLWVLTGLSAVCIAALLGFLPSRVVVSLVPAGAVAIGYCAAILPSRNGRVRLKQLPGAKLVLIAGVWTYATAGLPMLASGSWIDGQSMMILLSRFLFIAAVALPFDLPDSQRDRQSGIATLPTMLGESATRRVAVALACAAGLAALFNPWPAASGVLLSVACCVVLLGMLGPRRGWPYFMVALDGLLLVQAGALWLLAGM